MKKLLTSAALMLCTVFATFAQFSGSGSGTESDPYRIFNADQLTQLRNFLNQEGVYFKLQNDINIAAWLTDNYPNQGWQPVGSSSEPFKGVLDGNGKTISGFSINRSSTDYVGLFGYISGATIKNLTIEGNVTGNDYVGAFVGSGTFNVANILTGLKHIGATTGNYRVGGIVGACGGNISNLTVNGNVTGSSDDVGGAIGNSGEATGSISDVTVTGDVKNTSSSSSATGGIIGYTYVNISNATYSGNVTGGKHVGGIIGCAKGVRTFSNLTAAGTVTGTGSQFCGGICGKSDDGLTLTNGSSHCDVTGKQYTGGIIGGKQTGALNLTSCVSEGDITGEACTGGIVGSSGDGATNMTSCFADGNVTGTTCVGGICGRIQNPSSSSINGCNYWGDITGTSQLGGVVGAITTNYTDAIDTSSTTTAGYRHYLYQDASTSTNFYQHILEYTHTDCFYNTASPATNKKSRSSSGNVTYFDVYVNTSSIASDIGEWKKSSHNVYSYNGSSYGSTNAINDVYNNIKLTSASTNNNVNIQNCSAVSNINGTGTYIGGIVGQDISGSSANYMLSESKTVYYYVGNGVNTTTTALILKKYGYAYTTSNITESYFSGNLTGTNYIGGIAGTKQGGCINKCYASATINGGQYVGGIAGSLTKESLNTNENSLNANVSVCPSITGTLNVGRIYGSTDGNFSVAALGTTSENRAMTSTQVVTNGVTQTITDDLQNGTAVGVSQLRLKANYVAWGWNFNNYWTIQETESFPYKTWQTAPPTFSGQLTSGATTISGKSTDGGTVYLMTSSGKNYTATCSGSNWSVSVDALHAGETVTAYAAGTNKEKSYFTTTTVGYLGSGTEADPYQIASAEDLQGIYTGGYYKIMNDIDLTSWINQYGPTEGWSPVGYDGAPVYIDGDGHKISGLWTEVTPMTYVGLFSYLSGGAIRNLTVEVATNKEVKGYLSYTGIVIGRMDDGTIENVTATGSVKSHDYTGGIVGYANNTTLNQLSFTGELRAPYVGGGIAAQTTGAGAVSKCMVEAEFIGVAPTSQISGVTPATGGLIGLSSTPISQCSADVTITAPAYWGHTTGGLVGKQSNANIQQCSVSGSVNSVGDDNGLNYTGGLVGQIVSGTISDCYSTADVTGVKYTAGLVGIAGQATIERCYSTGDVNGIYYGGGIAAQLTGIGAKVKNCVAMNNQLVFTDQSSWASRVIGGFDEAAGEPDSSNVALATMQVSLNNVPQTKGDDLVEGFAKSETELKQQATYAALGWDFNDVWTMSADGYPVLQWQAESPSSVIIGDLTGDGKVSITDVVMIIDVIAGVITDANQKAAADVNGDGNVSITDCVAAIDLIAAQGSTPNSARRRAQAMLSNTDFISGAMEDNLLTISLDNEKRYTAFQMIVSVPEGMALGKATMDEMRGADHQAVVRDLGSGRYLVAGFSADNEELTGNSGSLLSIVTNGQGTGDIIISDIEFATTKAEAYYLADEVVSTIATGIEGTLMSGDRGTVYDLSGRKWSTANGQRSMLPKGVYIVNGKKINLK